MMKRFIILVIAFMLVLSVLGIGSTSAKVDSELLVLKFELAENSRILTWNEYPGAVSYYVYLDTSDDGKSEFFLPIHDFPVTETRFEDFIEITEKKFSYKVEAMDKNGDVIAESNIVTIHIKNLDCQDTYKFEVGSESYIKNNQEILFKKGKVILDNHRVYLPMTFLFGEMKYEMASNTGEKKVTLNQKNKKFEFWYSGEDFFTYNGKTLKFAENDPTVTVRNIEGVLYVPMFPVVRLMDAYDIKLDPFNLVIEMTFDCPEAYFPPEEMVSRSLSLTLDTDIITVDGEDYNTGCGLRLFDQKTYLPLEQVLLGFGLKTEWDDDETLHFYKWNYRNPEKKSVKFGMASLDSNEIVIEGESDVVYDGLRMEDGILYVAPGFMQFFEVATNWNGGTKTITFEMDVPTDAMVGLKKTQTVNRSVKFFMADEKDMKNYVMVDGQKYEGKPFTIKGGSSMIPIKYFAQGFGGHFAWKPEKNEMVIEMKKSAGNGEFVGLRAVFHTGEKEFEVDGEVFEMLQPGMILEGDFYVTAREVLTHFGVKGDWNTEEKAMSFISEVELEREIKLKKLE